MKNIFKLNEQIEDTQKMIANTQKLLEENENDSILRFMLSQDKSLLKQLKKQRTQELLEYLKNIESSADTILNDVYGEMAFHIDPFYMANKMGIDVVKNSDMGEKEAGKCYVLDDIITIEYKPQISHNRERFTVAHELGHIIKHMPYANNVHFEDSEELLYARSDYIDSANSQEMEADRLAGELLIPKKTVLYLLNSLEPSERLSTKMLQDLFKVSEGAIYHALKSYELLYHTQIKREFSWL